MLHEIRKIFLKTLLPVCRENYYAIISHCLPSALPVRKSGLCRVAFSVYDASLLQLDCPALPACWRGISVESPTPANTSDTCSAKRTRQGRMPNMEMLLERCFRAAVREP
eukprot:GHVU01118461.1.p2 GENE.GHVU01118461.1~~GHVU01118461.1.p2  ORF type:complete len:110 (-),score=0.18 GHVU01118461.1:3112-3441(-)